MLEVGRFVVPILLAPNVLLLLVATHAFKAAMSPPNMPTVLNPLVPDLSACHRLTQETVVRLLPQDRYTLVQSTPQLTRQLLSQQLRLNSSSVLAQRLLASPSVQTAEYLYSVPVLQVSVDFTMSSTALRS